MHYEIVSYLNLEDSIASMVALERETELVNLIEAIATEGHFASIREAIRDVCRYNEPELHSALHSIPDEVSADVTRVVREYRANMGRALWKYLPIGLRQSYDTNFNEVRDFRILPPSQTSPSNTVGIIPPFTMQGWPVKTMTMSYRFRDGHLVAVEVLGLRGEEAKYIVDLIAGQAVHVLDGGRYEFIPERRIAERRVRRSDEVDVWRSDSIDPVRMPSSPDFSLDGTHLVSSNRRLAYPIDYRQPMVAVDPYLHAIAPRASPGAPQHPSGSSYPSKPSFFYLLDSGSSPYLHLQDLTWPRLVEVFFRELRNLLPCPPELTHASQRAPMLQRMIPGDSPQQNLLRQILNLTIRPGGGQDSTWQRQLARLSSEERSEIRGLIGQFLRGRPYEEAAVSTLIRKTIAGDIDTIRDVGDVDMTPRPLVRGV